MLGLVGGALLLGRIPLCPFAAVTHHPCPGCGLTRATLALLQGHVSESLHFHPLVIPIAPLTIAAVAMAALRYVRVGQFESYDETRSRPTTAVVVVLGVLSFAVWIARFFGAFGGPVPV